MDASLYGRFNVVCARDLRWLEFPSSADLLMQGNWPIYQRQQRTERCRVTDALRMNPEDKKKK